MGKFLEVLIGRRLLTKKQERLLSILDEKGKEAFLKNLLEVMYLKSFKDETYRKSIENFSATYVFEGEGKYEAVYFNGGRVSVSQKELKAEPDVKVDFKDERGLYKFLLGEDVEYEETLHSSEIRYKGNINYIRRFSFMAREALIVKDK